MRARSLLFVLAFALAAPACSHDDPGALPNVRLGMSPRDVRERLRPGGEGSWKTSLGPEGDTIVAWRARDPGVAIPDARFEFHLGMLVAVRAHLHEATAGEQIAVTPKTVTMRRPAPEGGSELVVLSRDCPTHHEEAEGLVAHSGASSAP